MEKPKSHDTLGKWAALKFKWVHPYSANVFFFFSSLQATAATRYLHVMNTDCVGLKRNKCYLRVSTVLQIRILTCTQQDRWAHLHTGLVIGALKFYRDGMTRQSMNGEQECFCASLGRCSSPSLSGVETYPKVNFFSPGSDWAAFILNFQPYFYNSCRKAKCFCLLKSHS